MIVERQITCGGLARGIPASSWPSGCTRAKATQRLRRSEIELREDTVAPSGAIRPQVESLFDRYSWLYAFCRERLFRDDTDRVALALWPVEPPPLDSQLLELGCGPGFYARRLAERFRELQAIGVDLSERQLDRARTRALANGLTNCHFERANVLSLAQPDGSVDAIVASRLFTVLAEREQALCEMYRVLRPGGRCLITEPRSALRASVPLMAMWLAASVTSLRNRQPVRYPEPITVTVLPFPAFQAATFAQPWVEVRCWRDARYQYALCMKGTPTCDTADAQLGKATRFPSPGRSQ